MLVCELTFDLGVSLQLDGDDFLDTPGEPQSAFYEGPGVSARPRDTPAGSADTMVGVGTIPQQGPSLDLALPGSGGRANPSCPQPWVLPPCSTHADPSIGLPAHRVSAWASLCDRHHL